MCRGEEEVFRRNGNFSINDNGFLKQLLWTCPSFPQHRLMTWQYQTSADPKFRGRIWHYCQMPQNLAPPIRDVVPRTRLQTRAHNKLLTNYDTSILLLGLYYNLASVKESMFIKVLLLIRGRMCNITRRQRLGLPPEPGPLAHIQPGQASAPA